MAVAAGELEAVRTVVRDSRAPVQGGGRSSCGSSDGRRDERRAVALLGRNFYWGNGRGALVVARNGNRPAALGARLLAGRVRHGH